MPIRIQSLPNKWTGLWGQVATEAWGCQLLKGRLFRHLQRCMKWAMLTRRTSLTSKVNFSVSKCVFYCDQKNYCLIFLFKIWLLHRRRRLIRLFILASRRQWLTPLLSKRLTWLPYLHRQTSCLKNPVAMWANSSSSRLKRHASLQNGHSALPTPSRHWMRFVTNRQVLVLYDALSRCAPLPILLSAAVGRKLDRLQHRNQSTTTTTIRPLCSTRSAWKVPPNHR